MSSWKYFNPEEVKKEIDHVAYLCEYYNVSREEAINLGTRAAGRKPNLPGSETCKPVSGMTHEDIWESKKRKTLEDIFQFYVDQGAWSTFRQTIRHLELKGLHESFWSGIARSDMHIVEYGCGIAPFSTSLLQTANIHDQYDISLSDIDGAEHFIFGEWKLKKIIKEKELYNINVHSCPITPHKLPKYKKNIDLAIAFEVMEHVPSPVATLENLINQMSSQSLYLENFIKHDRGEGEDLGPDLKSAASERDKYYETLESEFILVSGADVSSDPNQTRLWSKK